MTSTHAQYTTVYNFLAQLSFFICHRWRYDQCRSQLSSPCCLAMPRTFGTLGIRPQIFRPVLGENSMSLHISWRCLAKVWSSYLIKETCFAFQILTNHFIFMQSHKFHKYCISIKFLRFPNRHFAKVARELSMASKPAAIVPVLRTGTCFWVFPAVVFLVKRSWRR